MMNHYVLDTNTLLILNGVLPNSASASKFIIPQPVLLELTSVAKNSKYSEVIDKVNESIALEKAIEFGTANFPISEIAKYAVSVSGISTNDLLIVHCAKSYRSLAASPEDKVFFVTDDRRLAQFARKEYGLEALTNNSFLEYVSDQRSEQTKEKSADLEVDRISLLEAEVSSLKKIITNVTEQFTLGLTYQSEFIDSSRIEELRLIQTSQFDLSRLVRLCEEINKSYSCGSYLATIMLIRAVLDHVPPIFNCRSFSEVAGNYSGGKSFKQCMEHLDKSSRKIADAYLHEQIRQRESLPNKTQVNFMSDLDTLLAEIGRVLK